MKPLRHVGIGFGRIAHWHDGLGEFSRQLGLALADRAKGLRAEHGVALHFHLPRRWHGEFGDQVGYLATHTLQRHWHPRLRRFALWHGLHQHIRLKPPAGTQRRLDTVHDLNFLHTKTGPKIERYRGRLLRQLARCDTVVAITHHVAADIRRELPALQAPVQVIHNGATDLAATHREPLTGVPATGFLLHISRMAPTKNIGALLDLAAAWPERSFVLAGARSDHTADVERRVHNEGLRNVHLRFDLSTAQKAWAYAHCDGFLFPSLTEGFGLPPLEAMHFGKPVFLSRLTSLPEVGGDAAFYFDDFAPAAMRQVIQAGLAAHADPQRAVQVRHHAEGFSWARCADHYIAQYLQLLERPAR